MATYTVTFTTRRLISQFDEAGNKLADKVEHKPQKITGLPYATAVSYKDQENFEFERELVEATKQLPKPQGSFDRVLKGARRATGKTKPAKSAVERAAATGDLAHALRSA